MGQVLRLPDRGWKNAAARRPSGPPKPLAANNFYCMRCSGDRFLLYSCSSVQCVITSYSIHYTKLYELPATAEPNAPLPPSNRLFET